ncbi:MAG: DUF1449 domain-containing protein [Cyanobacteriota bacterium]|jgi:hypothetical protein
MLLHSANLPFWFLLGLGLLCLGLIWLSGGEDEGAGGSGDEDFEVASRLDLDLDSDAPTDGIPAFIYFLSWLGFGQAPLLLLLGINFSLWGILGWGLNVLWARLAGGFPQGVAAWLVLLLPGCLSFWVGRRLSRPLGSVFKPFSQDTRSERLVGCLGVVTSKALPYRREGKVGQLLVKDSAGNVLTVSAALPAWAAVLPLHNQTALIIEVLPDQQGYLAIAKDSSDEDKWLSNADLA